MVTPSLSTRRLGDNEYHDGELHDLHSEDRAILKHALLYEPWVNVSEETKTYWLNLIYSANTRFVGTVISRPRQQIEVSVIFSRPHPVHGGMGSICVTLSHFARFGNL